MLHFSVSLFLRRLSPERSGFQHDPESESGVFGLTGLDFGLHWVHDSLKVGRWAPGGCWKKNPIRIVTRGPSWPHLRLLLHQEIVVGQIGEFFRCRDSFREFRSHVKDRALREKVCRVEIILARCTNCLEPVSTQAAVQWRHWRRSGSGPSSVTRRWRH